MQERWNGEAKHWREVKKKTVWCNRSWSVSRFTLCKRWSEKMGTHHHFDYIQLTRFLRSLWFLPMLVVAVFFSSTETRCVCAHRSLVPFAKRKIRWMTFLSSNLLALLFLRSTLVSCFISSFFSRVSFRLDFLMRMGRMCSPVVCFCAFCTNLRYEMRRSCNALPVHRNLFAEFAFCTRAFSALIDSVVCRFFLLNVCCARRDSDKCNTWNFVFCFISPFVAASFSSSIFVSLWSNSVLRMAKFWFQEIEENELGPNWCWRKRWTRQTTRQKETENKFCGDSIFFFCCFDFVSFLVAETRKFGAEHQDKDNVRKREMIGIREATDKSRNQMNKKRREKSARERLVYIFNIVHHSRPLSPIFISSFFSFHRKNLFLFLSRFFFFFFTFSLACHLYGVAMFVRASESKKQLKIKWLIDVSQD